MKFGLHVGTRGAAGTPEGLVAIAQRAEALGFTHLGLSDHVVIAERVDSPYPYTADGKWFAQDTGFCLEQISTLAFIAGVTERIRLLTSVMVLPHRQPILAAKMLATADVLSRGRVTVGVGAGWMAEEMALLGGPPHADRGKAADEYIAAFKALWTEDKPRYSGEFVEFEGLLFEPKPVQKPHPPLWGGGESRPARRRAARLCDAWYPVINNPRARLDTAENYGAALADTRRLAEEAGRDPEALDTGLLAIWFRMGLADSSEAPRAAFQGTPEAIIGDIRAYADQGLRNLVINFESDDLDHTLGRLDAFAAEVMVAFR